jgi:P-type Ca2+ transporter type 2C
MVLVIYLPALQPIFHTVPIELKDWLLIAGMSALPTFLLAGSFFAGKKR